MGWERQEERKGAKHNAEVTEKTRRARRRKQIPRFARDDTSVLSWEARREDRGEILRFAQDDERFVMVESQSTG